MKRIVIGSVLMLTLAGTVLAASSRFSDVEDHHPVEAIEWAVNAGLTQGYDDGTFRPDVALKRKHALVFMERYYDNVLKADSSSDFTRADMMFVLHQMSEGGGSQSPTTTTTTVVDSGTGRIVDEYWAQDMDHYYVVVHGLSRYTSCTLDMTLDGRLIGKTDWEYERSGLSDPVIFEFYVPESLGYEWDGYWIDCQS